MTSVAAIVGGGTSTLCGPQRLRLRFSLRSSSSDDADLLRLELEPGLFEKLGPPYSDLTTGC